MVYIIIGKHPWPLHEQVFISWGCRNKWPKTGWPQTRERHSLSILQTRSLRIRSQQGHGLSKDSRGGSFLASSGGCLQSFSFIPWFVADADVYLQTLSPASHVHLPFPSVSLFSLMRTIIILDSVPTLMHNNFLLTWLHLQRPYFQTRSYS